MKNLIIILIITFLYSCSVKPVKIAYGSDACHFCKMNIVDKMHASQIVTNKGKAFKYDAIECLLNDIARKDLNSIQLYLVTNYNKPSELVDATEAIYVVSESIQSPMGGNLASFITEQEAKAITSKIENGKIYNWKAIQELYHKN